MGLSYYFIGSKPSEDALEQRPRTIQEQRGIWYTASRTRSVAVVGVRRAPPWRVLASEGRPPMPARHLLVVTTNTTLRQRMERDLRASELQLWLADDDAAASALLASKPIHVLVLDIAQVDDGAIVRCQRLRDRTSVPLIAVMPAHGDKATLTTLTLTVDDYLFHPLDINELHTRVLTLLRRQQQDNASNAAVIAFGRITIDLHHRQVRRDGQLLALPPTAYAVLAELVRHPHTIVSNQVLLQRVWGDAFVGADQYVRQRIYLLRQELEDDPRAPRYLKKASGGYRFVPDTATAAASQPAQPEAPPRAQLRVVGNLPHNRTSFVGRETDRQQLIALLLQEDKRLLTLLGPAGVGKTRLALETAQALVPDFADGVVVIALADVQQASEVLPTIAQALGVPDSERPLLEVLIEHLAAKRLLVVLDNVEQVIDAAPLFSSLLNALPRLTLLVTSRSELRLYGEQRYHVAPLALPPQLRRPSPKRLSSYPAVRLFVDRVRALRHNFTATAEEAEIIVAICRRLDGLPLAIELAAARGGEMALAALLARLDQPLAVLVGGPRDVPERQQSVGNAIAWSYALLSPTEQHVFAQLGVFAGGCTREAARAICMLADEVPAAIDSAVQLLIAKSLLQDGVVTAEQPRLLLLETIREYALERLREQGADQLLRQRHAAYYLGVAEQGEDAFNGPDQAHWLAYLELEHDNLRAAMAWGLTYAPDLALRIASALRSFWHRRGYLREGQRWLEAGLKLASVTSAVRAKALNAVGVLAWSQGRYREAQQALERSVDLWQELNDTAQLANTRCNLGIVLQEHGQYDAAASQLAASLAHYRALDAESDLVFVLNNLGVLEYNRGAYAQAQPLIEESLALCIRRNDTQGIAIARENLGMIMRECGDLVQAKRLFTECLQLQQDIGDDHDRAYTLTNLGIVALHQGDYSHARTMLTEALCQFQQIGNQQGIIAGLEALAALLAATGQPQTALRLWSAAEAAREALVIPRNIPDQVRYGTMIEATSQKLSPPTAATAIQQGRLLTLADAVALATDQDNEEAE